MKRITGSILLFLVMAFSIELYAAPVQWKSAEGGNNNWYNDGTWNDATNLYPREAYFIEYPVPEPATVLLVGVGLIGLAWFRKRFFPTKLKIDLTVPEVAP